MKPLFMGGLDERFIKLGDTEFIKMREDVDNLKDVVADISTRMSTNETYVKKSIGEIQGSLSTIDSRVDKLSTSAEGVVEALTNALGFFKVSRMLIRGTKSVLQTAMICAAVYSAIYATSDNPTPSEQTEKTSD